MVSSHPASHQSCEADLLGKNCLAEKAIHPWINPWFSCFDDKIMRMGPRKNFIRIWENFVCESCKEEVIGNGYTNHCPNCLFSKHVDENIPGDRGSSCQSLMEPIGVEQKHGEYFILHRCQKCGKLSKNKASSEDNFEKIMEISKSR